MKKMKGVAAAADSPPPSYATMYEDPRIMFKHQSLMQDYEELYKVIAFLGFQRFLISLWVSRSGVLLDLLCWALLICFLGFWGKQEYQETGTYFVDSLICSSVYVKFVLPKLEIRKS